MTIQEQIHDLQHAGLNLLFHTHRIIKKAKAIDGWPSEEFNRAIFNLNILWLNLEDVDSGERDLIVDVVLSATREVEASCDLYYRAMVVRQAIVGDLDASFDQVMSEIEAQLKQLNGTLSAIPKPKPKSE